MFSVEAVPRSYAGHSTVLGVGLDLGQPVQHVGFLKNVAAKKLAGDGVSVSKEESDALHYVPVAQAVQTMGRTFNHRSIQ